MWFSARDTLRFEAGRILYGRSMDVKLFLHWLANMGWTLTWEPLETHLLGRKPWSAESRCHEN